MLKKMRRIEKKFESPFRVGEFIVALYLELISIFGLVEISFYLFIYLLIWFLAENKAREISNQNVTFLYFSRNQTDGRIYKLGMLLLEVLNSRVSL